jgi:hypothetical protein
VPGNGKPVQIDNTNRHKYAGYILFAAFKIKYQVIASSFIYKSGFCKQLLVGAETKNAYMIPAGGHTGDDQLIAGGVVDLFNNACTGMIVPVKDYQHRIYRAGSGKCSVEPYGYVNTVFSLLRKDRLVTQGKQGEYD